MLMEILRRRGGLEFKIPYHGTFCVVKDYPVTVRVAVMAGLQRRLPRTGVSAVLLPFYKCFRASYPASLERPVVSISVEKFVETEEEERMPSSTAWCISADVFEKEKRLPKWLADRVVRLAKEVGADVVVLSGAVGFAYPVEARREELWGPVGRFVLDVYALAGKFVPPDVKPELVGRVIVDSFPRDLSFRVVDVKKVLFLNEDVFKKLEELG